MMSLFRYLESAYEGLSLSYIILGEKVEEIPEATFPVPPRTPLIIIRKLLRGHHHLIHPHAVEAGDGEPRGVAAEGGAVDEALVLPVAHHLQVVADVDLEHPAAAEVRDQPPRAALGVRDLQAPRALEEDGEAAVVGVRRQAEGEVRVGARRVAVHGHDLHALVELVAQVVPPESEALGDGSHYFQPQFPHLCAVLAHLFPGKEKEIIIRNNFQKLICYLQQQ